MKYNYKPSLEELRSSFKDRSKEYLLENTLHGVPYFVDRSRPKRERVAWFILTMASVGATIGTIVTIWDKFQNEPTLTGIVIRTENIDIDLPQIYLCYDWDQLNHSLLNEREMYIYQQLYTWSWGKEIYLNASDVVYEKKSNFRSTFEMLTPRCSILLNNCSVTGIRDLCGKIFVEVVTSNGVCCKFNATRPLRVSDVPYGVSFGTSTYPLKLYLMNKFDIGPERNERPMLKVYSPIILYFGLEITIAGRDIRHLTLWQRQCHFHEETSVNACEMNCLSNNIFKHCKCLPWFLLSPGKEECPISKYSCIKKTYVDVTECKCILSCNHIAYNILHIDPSISANNISEVKLQNWPRLAYSRETRFGYLDLLVSFGGIAGLFLGYSLLSSVELGYYFSLRSYCGAVVDSSRKKHNITTVHVIGAKPSRKLDVNPVYYQYVD